MEQFIFGLLAGVALGMWGAILLYRYTGKAQPGWPLSRKQGDTTPSAKALDESRPADDFTEEYYAQQEANIGSTLGAQAFESGVSADLSASAELGEHPEETAAGMPVASDAKASVVYTGLDSNVDTVGPDEASREDDAALVDKSPGAEPGDAPATVSQPDAYAILLTRMDGDVKSTEALIDAERERTPAVPRTRLIENALLRLHYGQQ